MKEHYTYGDNDSATNVRTWGHDPFAVAAFDASEIASMTEAGDA
jgi:hypothetical protein